MSLLEGMWSHSMPQTLILEDVLWPEPGAIGGQAWQLALDGIFRSSSTSLPWWISGCFRRLREWGVAPIAGGVLHPGVLDDLVESGGIRLDHAVTPDMKCLTMR